MDASVNNSGGSPASGGGNAQQPRHGVLTYHTGWAANCLAWSQRPGTEQRLAVASFLPQYANVVDIVERDPATNQIVTRASFEHWYPVTKVLFSPSQSTSSPDLLVTTGDFLRVWALKPRRGGAAAASAQPTDTASMIGGSTVVSVGASSAAGSVAGGAAATDPSARNVDRAGNKLGAAVKDGPTVDTDAALLSCYNNNKSSDFCSPLTACDWNADDARFVAASSIDTTVSIWDLSAERITTQLIAHDKEVYDVAFAKGTHVFASCGADGSLRIFDTREMEHCTIVYESPDLKPLLRCAWNKLDHTYIATFGASSNLVYIVDVRFPSMPVGSLTHHTAPVNALAWAPQSGTYLCTAGEDRNALIWDLAELPNLSPRCLLTYRAPAEINAIGWSHTGGEDWVATTGADWLRLLKV